MANANGGASVATSGSSSQGFPLPRNRASRKFAEVASAARGKEGKTTEIRGRENIVGVDEAEGSTMERMVRSVRTREFAAWKPFLRQTAKS